MSTYVMSDLHGMYEKFLEMLNKIKFREKDELYIAGDILDRGEKPLEILDYIREHKNIHLLKGNHEKMFEDFVETRDYFLWFSNGGNSTYKELLDRGNEYFKDMYEYIKKLPLVVVLKKKKIILVHAGVYYPENNVSLKTFMDLQEEDICLWDRSNIGKEKKYLDYTVICGHTPVQTINNENKIIKTDGTIYIDCGAVFVQAGGKLACLRLEDMKEFYI